MIHTSQPIGTLRFIGCTGKQLDTHTVRIDSIKPYGFAAVEITAP